jgi:hypothetical protein
MNLSDTEPIRYRTYQILNLSDTEPIRRWIYMNPNLSDNEPIGYQSVSPSSLKSLDDRQPLLVRPEAESGLK